MVKADDNGNGFRSARPSSGDLVDRYLEASLRAALFGGTASVTLGRLQIEGPLGRGAMGSILSAFDPVLDRHVAVKGLVPGRSQDTDQLLREARLLAKLDHNNIVSVYDVVEAEHTVYLVMERVEGDDLRHWMSKPRPWQEVVPLFVQIGRGLDAAHGLDIAHCDVKPENIVVSDDRPRLIDFGLAHRLSDGTARGGTPAYLAPERLAGATGSPAADQYAFFATMVEAIEGERPRENQPWPHMPRWLRAVARRGLAAKPELRFPDMTAAVLALQPPRRLAWTAGIAAAALVAGGGVVFAVSGQSPDPCQNAGDQVAAVWSEQARRGLRAGIEGSGVAGASSAAGKVEESIDEYARSWASRRTNSCQATRVRAEQSVELLDFSMHCFDQRLDELAAVISLFSNDPNERVVEQATKTASELGSLETCMDPAALAAAIPLPTEPKDQETLRALESTFQNLRNLDRRGDYKQALAQSAELESSARKLDYPPFTVRVLVLRARLQVVLNELADAETTLRNAASEAARAKDDGKLAEVWIQVIELLAQQSRFDEALTLEPVAVTAAERVTGNDEVRARLHNALGGIFLAKARYKDAYAAYEKALAIQRKIGRDGNQAFAPAVANFGLAKWYTGDLPGAHADMKEALGIMLEDIGPDHPRVAYAHQNVADLEMQLGGSGGGEAEPHYREALRIWSKSLGPDHPNLAHPYEKLALVAKKKGELAKAYENAKRGLALREKHLGPNHPLVVQTLGVLIDLYVSEGTPERLADADKAIAKALAIEKELGVAGKRFAPYTLYSRASVAERRGKWKSALKDLEAVLALRLESVGENHLDTANSLGNVGRIALKLKRLGKADTHFLRAQKIFDAVPGQADDHRVAMRQGRAEVRLARARWQEAADIYKEALAIANAAKLDRRHEVRFHLAKALYRSGSREAAVAHARQLAAELDGTTSPIQAQLQAWLAGK